MTTESTSIEDLLSYRLSTLARLINRRSTRYLWEWFGLTLAEWRCLSVIAELKQTTVREISERTNSDKAQVSRASASLTSKGLISREKNAEDARSGIYTMTQKGQRQYEEIMPIRIAENEHVLDALTPHEQDQLVDYLNRIQDAVFSFQDESRRPG
ncbi:MAG: MarR family winged helix-turn-helix transcriptional regulator [Pseudomonadota bacterium]